MRNRVLMSLLVIGLAAALVGGATMAWFTDAADTDEVEFQAGTLMIDVDKEMGFESLNTDFASLNRLNPGDKWQWEFDIENIGTKSADWLLYICYKDTNGRKNLGDEHFGEGRAEFGTGDLSDALLWTITVGDVQVLSGEKLSGSPMLLTEDTFDALNDENEDEGNRSRHVTVVAELPGKGTGNKFQGAKMDLCFGVKAWQTTNEAPPATVTAQDCPWYDPVVEPTKYIGILNRNNFAGVFQDGTNSTIGNPNGVVKITNAKDEDGNLANGTLNVTFYYPGYDDPAYSWNGRVEFTNGKATVAAGTVSFTYPSKVFRNQEVQMRILG